VRSSSESLALIPSAVHANVELDDARDVAVAVVSDEQRVFDNVEKNFTTTTATVRPGVTNIVTVSHCKKRPWQQFVLSVVSSTRMFLNCILAFDATLRAHSNTYVVFGNRKR
jgi:hypothetical protein